MIVHVFFRYVVKVWVRIENEILCSFICLVSISTVQVKMVRIQTPDRKQLITHTNTVTVGLLEDEENDIVYLRIGVNQKVYL